MQIFTDSKTKHKVYFFQITIQNALENIHARNRNRAPLLQVRCRQIEQFVCDEGEIKNQRSERPAVSPLQWQRATPNKPSSQQRRHRVTQIISTNKVALVLFNTASSSSLANGERARAAAAAAKGWLAGDFWVTGPSPPPPICRVFCCIETFFTLYALGSRHTRTEYAPPTKRSEIEARRARVEIN